MTSATVRSIQINTEVPGPKSKEILARRSAAIPKGLSLSTPIVVAKAHGAVVTDVDGNTFLDFAGGIGAVAAGHTPSPVVDAIKAQADDLIHICSVVATTESYVELCEVLNKITPGNYAKKTVLSSTGAEAVENAIRCVRSYTGRPAIICFEGGYHGRSMLTASLTSKYDTYKKGFGPFSSDVYKLTFPYLYRRLDHMTADQFIDQCIWQFDHALTAQVDPSAVAAVLLEPVQGESGFIPAPKRYLEHLYKRCKEHKMLLIVDEVQTGFGRTGKLFASEHYDIEPDILVTAKSIGSGTPISAITGRAEILDAPQIGGIGGTYGGNPLACVAALRTIEYMQQIDIAARAEQIGKVMRAEFERWQQEIPLIGDVRGMGAMLAMELVTDLKTKAPAKEQTSAIVAEVARRGVITIKAGLYSNCVRMLMPLVITDEQLAEGLEALEGAIRAIAR
jgi:4-aminobutyrate aminotransferase / (S)-3-amino-2-methylpropionate transaminase / 5-aminovalerate transaminase